MPLLIHDIQYNTETELKTFPTGGVHPPENKLTANCPIQYLPLPQSVAIPVSQHIGAPANIIVNKGDSIKDRTGNC